MEFEDAPPLAYFEGSAPDDWRTTRPPSRRYRLHFELLTASALQPEKSLALIEAMAQDYAHEELP